jgi:SAM-dependent methyltransferase
MIPALDRHDTLEAANGNGWVLLAMEGRMRVGWFSFRRKRYIVATTPARRFLVFGGRRHLADAPYLLPKDDQEINRLDFQHYMFRYVLRGNFLAPIGQPSSILDVGCGTGRWAIEMATQFPNANVVGVDLVPPPVDEMRPEQRPDNYAFVQGNVLQGLPFTDATFDFVHQRLLYAAVPAGQWQGVVNELARVTRPHGWVELLEGSAVMHGGGPGWANFSRWGDAASERRGIDIHAGQRLGAFLQAAGLRRVEFREIRLPVGDWGGRLGRMVEANLLAVFMALRMPIVSQGIASAEEFDANVAAMKAEVARGRCMWSAYVAYGQRPA